MKEHAVFWRSSDDPGSVYGGGVVVEPGRVSLRGSDGRARVVETVSADELAAVGAADEESIGGFPSVRLQLRGGRSLVIAAALGAAAVAELVDSLASLLLVG